MRALISVSDKRDLGPFAQGLQALDIELFSTGGTLKFLQSCQVNARTISDLTKFPEILDGRVKTLHPAVHGAILARRTDPEHMTTLIEHGIEPIDVVVVNLYPFAETIAREDVTQNEVLEQIDIGGPTLVRASAKNYPDVLVMVDPSDYPTALEALRNGTVPLSLRRSLAAKAFAHTAAYDSLIAAHFTDELFPTTFPRAFHKAQNLRYGENPHQQAALYGDFFQFFEKLHGKELSYINILDVTGAQELVEEFPSNEGVALAIIKHTNPCGVGIGATPLEAWQRAFATDQEAPFGGIIALNHPVDVALAQTINEIFSEIIIAPDFEPDALDILRTKKNRRLLRSLSRITESFRYLIHSVPGGVLVQEPDNAPLADEPFNVVTQRVPTHEEVQALQFAWRVVKHVKSNAIVYSNAECTLGIGAGQMSRVDSSRVAAWKAQNAGLSLTASVVASDALFPFPDGVEVAASAGATAVIQPGGSVRDDEVIAAANRLGMAMVFTKRRHFRH
ncbi:MAG: bifunctional phosphoribosylaminoimidazolecarboxamide formyltransferase/IMP cyclohydrolase PurH [Chloroflexi bacterium AL-W]|nr:bifunctional phosphoribosylaminoimidazolecarboxamide formyltransferase/IMP cyclohydrolase PurH [Chloroflexi bacterium AL-N1]NOK69948.1 bifunctional phosphoribosylaminoimidazolecarboxamide formyltransferase/IMP cyclohydrolase PurH [Chloroflexi bacterium AL-N10]NOK73755.1 bifunctional phosphoribosylaminoimidazolecarboxamide formyltransferase/IMP cyclohydrolase PurH [Chloroflexi bacterium AL-N5]NOK85480.1 bifunctional phosphoribosylaminoimidazolecarboxamide formyltransferase/IMP cyclohydrolase P